MSKAKADVSKHCWDDWAVVPRGKSGGKPTNANVSISNRGVIIVGGAVPFEHGGRIDLLANHTTLSLAARPSAEGRLKVSRARTICGRSGLSALGLKVPAQAMPVPHEVVDGVLVLDLSGLA